jgi:hypothetical protein
MHSVNVGAAPGVLVAGGPQFVAAETLKSEMDALQRELNESQEELRVMKVRHTAWCRMDVFSVLTLFFQINKIQRKDRQSYSVIDAMSVENLQLKNEIAELEV